MIFGHFTTTTCRRRLKAKVTLPTLFVRRLINIRFKRSVTHRYLISLVFEGKKGTVVTMGRVSSDVVFGRNCIAIVSYRKAYFIFDVLRVTTLCFNHFETLSL